MDSLVKQTRVRFSGLEQDNQGGLNNTRERRLPPPKTQSFKGERKNWFQRQFSGQLNQDKDSSDGIEFATMIAAAAFAVSSLEEAGMQKHKKTAEELENTFTSKSRKKENRIVLADPGRASRQFSGKEMVKVEKLTPEAAGRAPRIKRTPTFSDAHVNDTAYKRPGTSEDTRLSKSLTLSSTGDGQQKTNSTVSRGAETQARAWEEAEMTKIKKRYEKMKSTIDSWEHKKKKKEKRRIDRIESQLEKRRVRTLQHYRVEISKIEKVAEGARALADERKKKEETKTKEKAKKIRSKGKLPAT